MCTLLELKVLEVGGYKYKTAVIYQRISSINRRGARRESGDRRNVQTHGSELFENLPS